MLTDNQGRRAEGGEFADLLDGCALIGAWPDLQSLVVCPAPGGGSRAARPGLRTDRPRRVARTSIMVCTTVGHEHTGTDVAHGAR